MVYCLICRAAADCQDTLHQRSIKTRSPVVAKQTRKAMWINNRALVVVVGSEGPCPVTLSLHEQQRGYLLAVDTLTLRVPHDSVQRVVDALSNRKLAGTHVGWRTGLASWVRLSFSARSDGASVNLSVLVYGFGLGWSTYSIEPEKLHQLAGVWRRHAAARSDQAAG